MIRRLAHATGVLAALWTTPALAQEAPPTEAPPVEAPPTDGGETDETTGDPISKYRTKFDVLADRTIGTASKPVAFNWRRTSAHLAAQGTFLFELNNFNSARIGGLARFPTGGTLIEVGVMYAHVWDTPSSRLLALTPYRQPGRPSRLELDVTLAYPLAEGVVTSVPKFFPAVQLVFNAYAGIRYSVYPTGWGGLRPTQVIGAILSPGLTDTEVDNLDEERLQAMQVDRGRYGLLAGFGNDIYFEQGFFLSPRILVAVPLLAPASGTDLLFYADVSMAVGWAF